MGAGRPPLPGDFGYERASRKPFVPALVRVRDLETRPSAPCSRVHVPRVAGRSEVDAGSWGAEHEGQWGSDPPTLMIQTALPWSRCRKPRKLELSEAGLVPT